MYFDFVFLDRFLFELSCKNTHTHTQTWTHTHTHRDSNEYPIVAFSKNATIINTVNKVLQISSPPPTRCQRTVCICSQSAADLELDRFGLWQSKLAIKNKET